MHSYGGIAGTEALQGFHNGSEKGAGALLGLVYMSTMLPKKGDSFEARLECVGDYKWIPAREALTVVVFIPYRDFFGDQVCYGDLCGV